jgi:hypothetical protein
MKRARPLFLLVIAALALVLLCASQSLAGSQDDPEVTDSEGDTTTARDSHDVIKAWVEDENENNLVFRMEMTNLDVFSPRDDWQTLPTTYYEYFFTISKENSKKDYVLRASIPVHGFFAAFASYSLYEVNYTSGDEIEYDSVGSSGGQYNAASRFIEMTVSKQNINSPTRGNRVTHMWAAVFFEPRNQDRDLVDKAMSYNNPGTEYLVRGNFTQYYDVQLEVLNSTFVGAPRSPARINITIVSASTTPVNVTLSNSTMPDGWEVNWSRDKDNLLIPEDGTVSLTFIVNIPDDTPNGTRESVSIFGHFYTDEGVEIDTNTLNLIVLVSFIPPKAPEVRVGLFQGAWDWMVENWYISIAIIAVIVIAAVYSIIKYIQRRQEQQAMMDIQDYIRAQKEQREVEEA